MQRSLDKKLAAIRANPQGTREFILADAKDADMAFGVHAPKLKRELLVSDWRPVGGRQAAALQIEPEGTVLYAERVDTIERQPVAWDQAMIHRDYAGKLTAADLARVDFLEIWMKRGRFQVSKCVQTIEAVAATASVAKRLGLRASVPILRSTEIYLGPAGRPAGVFVSYYHPEHLCIRYQFQWNRKEFSPTSRAPRPITGLVRESQWWRFPTLRGAVANHG